MDAGGLRKCIGASFTVEQVKYGCDEAELLTPLHYNQSRVVVVLLHSMCGVRLLFGLQNGMSLLLLKMETPIVSSFFFSLSLSLKKKKKKQVLIAVIYHIDEIVTIMY